MLAVPPRSSLLLLLAALPFDNSFLDSISQLSAVSKELELIVGDWCRGFLSLLVREGNAQRFEFVSKARLVLDSEMLVHFGECVGVRKDAAGDSMQGSLELLVVHFLIVRRVLLKYLYDVARLELQVALRLPLEKFCVPDQAKVPAEQHELAH